MSAHATIVDRPLEASTVLTAVGGPMHGAVILFLGTVRNVNEGRAVTGMEYTAYAAMAAREMATIVTEAETQFPGARVAVEHRVGTLAIGEASVAIAASHAHRDLAYAASRYVIEQLKTRVPIWKREHYVDGTREWIDPTNGRSADARPPVTPARRSA